MELVLPNNYVEIDEEEMMYLDGGWSPNKVIRNCIGVGSAACVGWVFRQIGNFVRSHPGVGLWRTIGAMAGSAWRCISLLPWWAKLAGFGAGAAVIYALGTWDLF